MLGDAAMQIEIGRLLDDARGGGSSTAATSRARKSRWRRSQVADVLHQAVDTAIQLNGARGYSKDTPLEWIYRYARQARLVDGASEVHDGVHRARAARRRGRVLGGGPSTRRPTPRASVPSAQRREQRRRGTLAAPDRGFQRRRKFVVGVVACQRDARCEESGAGTHGRRRARIGGALFLDHLRPCERRPLRTAVSRSCASTAAASTSCASRSCSAVRRHHDGDDHREPRRAARRRCATMSGRANSHWPGRSSRPDQRVGQVERLARSPR